MSKYWMWMNYRITMGYFAECVHGHWPVDVQRRRDLVPKSLQSGLFLNLYLHLVLHPLNISPTIFIGNPVCFIIEIQYTCRKFIRE